MTHTTHVLDRSGGTAAPSRVTRLVIPPGREEVTLEVDAREVRLTNLDKVFFPRLGLRKRDLLQYYADVAPALLPHLRDRAMVMKRYPNGIDANAFYMKRAPVPRPEWIRTCAIQHGTGEIDFPVVDDLPTLLWLINLGCIDLHQWFARCDDPEKPDYLHFDLDPGSADFQRVRETAAIVRDALDALAMPSFVKTSGSKGLHVYVPLVRGPTQHEVWLVAKTIAVEVAAAHTGLMTAEYAVRKRPPGRVLIDYNQNQLGRTLASVYSVRPVPRATVSMPVPWRDLAAGASIADFRIDNVPSMLRRSGDRWAPLLHSSRPRFDLRRVL